MQIVFEGTITARRPGRVQYRFVRSDGAIAPIQTLEFSAPGTQTVRTTWTLGGPGLPSYTGWQAIEIVYPVQVLSGKAAFTIQCTSAGAAPAAPVITGYRYTGDCVAKGSRFTILGSNFGSREGKVASLGGHGISVDLPVVSWADTEIVVELPNDPRIQEGQWYYVGIQQAAPRRWLSNIDRTFTVCRGAAAQTPPPFSPLPRPTELPLPPQPPTPTPRPTATAIVVPTWTPPPGWLSGWVDLHTHPQAHLGFGAMLINGAPDVGSLRRGGCDDKYGRVTRPEEALRDSNWIHGGHGFFDNPCGDHLRKQFIDQLQRANRARDTSDAARGYPDFPEWPAWDDIVHQKMYVDWVRRAYELGNLRVMVALAVNNKTLADAVRGPGDDLPNTDKESGDLQIEEMKRFVARHSSWMEVAYTAADLRRIVRANKLAVVLGLELDALGNFYRTATPAQVQAELDRLYSLGVRYVIPVAHIDNAFGGTAVYNSAFNLSNHREFGRYWQLRTSGNGISFCYRHDVGVEMILFAAAKLRTIFPGAPAYPPCPHKNARGLTDVGDFALRYMMRKGFLIDIDHMSDLTSETVLSIAEGVPGGYPLNSGHTGIRPPGRTFVGTVGENTRTTEQLRRIAQLGGMFGLGTESTTPREFSLRYFQALEAMGWRPGMPSPVAIGSDTNGLVKLPRPLGSDRVPGLYGGDFPPPRTGSRTWDINDDGVAHYGMFADFLRAWRRVVVVVGGPQPVDTLNTSAEYFARMWEKVERVRSGVRVP